MDKPDWTDILRTFVEWDGDAISRPSPTMAETILAEAACERIARACDDSAAEFARAQDLLQAHATANGGDLPRDATGEVDIAWLEGIFAQARQNRTTH